MFLAPIYIGLNTIITVLKIPPRLYIIYLEIYYIVKTSCHQFNSASISIKLQIKLFILTILIVDACSQYFIMKVKTLQIYLNITYRKGKSLTITISSRCCKICSRSLIWSTILTRSKSKLLQFFFPWCDVKNRTKRCFNSSNPCFSTILIW